MAEDINMIDLSAGMGARTLAFEAEGFKVIYSYEKDKIANRIYEKNIGWRPGLNESEYIDPDRLPCADVIADRILGTEFSIASGKSSQKESYTFLDIVRLMHPKIIILEGSCRSIKYIEKLQLKDCLTDLGYNVFSRAISSQEYTGLPLCEMRQYVIGIASELNKTFLYPEGNYKAGECVLPFRDIIDESIDQKYLDMGKIRVKDEGKGFYCWKPEYHHRAGMYFKEDLVSGNFIKGTLFRDELGFRSLTNREFASLKGFPDAFDYGKENQKKRRLITYESNVGVDRLLAHNIKMLLCNISEENGMGGIKAQSSTVCKRDNIIINKIETNSKEVKKTMVVKCNNVNEMETNSKEDKKPKMQKKKCFVIMPFGDPLDDYYKKIIKPAIELMNYQVKRADEIYGVTPIIEDITEGIKEADFLIADATGKNPNVNYELGYAHALNKKVIIISQRLEDVPFDYRHRRVIIYDPRKVEWQEKLREVLQKTVEVIT